MSFYKDHYQVVIIGGGLSGFGTALQLQQKGITDILILEKHNLPGGLASSYVRDGIEIEATLHEMMSIGPKEDRLKVGQFLDDCGVDIDWMRVPEAYRLILTGEDIDITLHAGFRTMADEIGEQYPEWKEKIYDFMCLCGRVYNSMNYLSTHTMSKAAMLVKHPDFVKTLGYTAKEVMDTYGFPTKIREILSAYWIYVANPLSTLPFTIYAFLMADYFRGGSYVCRGFSHEISMKMERKVEEQGAQIEFSQEVDKILVKDGHVTGVRTKRGDEISCDYVVSGAYPNRVYTQMIEPSSAVPEGAIKAINSRKLSVCPVSVMMVLKGTPEEIGIESYSVFSGDHLDTDELWEESKQLGNYNYLSAICLNLANPGCTPEGYTQLSITALPLVDGFLNVREEDYYQIKQDLAADFIRRYEEDNGIVIHDKIVEIEVSTPFTISHYVGAWKGSVYGYQHNIKDHAVARMQMADREDYISGLAFNGSAAVSGNGMAPSITNGRAAASYILKHEAAKGEKA